MKEHILFTLHFKFSNIFLYNSHQVFYFLLFTSTFTSVALIFHTILELHSTLSEIRFSFSWMFLFLTYSLNPSPLPPHPHPHPFNVQNLLSSLACRSMDFTDQSINQRRYLVELNFYGLEMQKWNARTDRVQIVDQ